jgi:hypothetical protein
MSNLYDDNYGFYEDGDDPEETRKFYQEVQRDSVWKKCKRCGRRVKLRRDYAICNSCADKLERGMDC